MTKYENRGSYHHGDLRKTLIDATIKLLKTQTNHDFSMREVARISHVSHSAPSKHFATKRHLLSAVAASGFASLEFRMTEEIAGLSDPRQAFSALAHAYIGFAVSEPGLYRLMFGREMAEEDAVEALSAGRQARTVLERVILEGARQGIFQVNPADTVERNLLAFICSSALHGLATFIIDGLAVHGELAATLTDKMVGLLLGKMVLHQTEAGGVENPSNATNALFAGEVE